MTGRVLVHSRVATGLSTLVGGSLLAVVLGWAAVGHHQKTIIFLLAPLALALILRAGSKNRFAILLFVSAAIPILSRNMLPLGVFFGLALVAALVVAHWTSRVSSRVTHGMAVGLPLVLFLGLGMAAMLVNGDGMRAGAVCFTPAVWYLAAAAFVRGPREALRVQAACAIGGLVYLLIVLVSGALGWGGASLSAVAGDPGQTGMSRLGAQAWTLHSNLLAIQFYPTWLATLLALAMPAAFLLFFRATGRWGARFWWALAGLSLAYGLLLTGARAGATGALVGTSVTLVASGRFRIRRVLVWSATAAVSVLAFGFLLMRLLSSVVPSANVARIVAVLSTAHDPTGNLAGRLRILRETLALASGAPLGHGFAYWSLRGRDDAIVFAMLLNGVGPLAVLCMTALLLVLLTAFVRRARGSVSDGRDAVAIGLGVLVAGFLAGVGSHSVLIEPVQSFIFWGFAMTAYWAAHPLEPIGSARSLQLSTGELRPQGVGGVRTAPAGSSVSGTRHRS
jgi:hypothetical protein